MFRHLRRNLVAYLALFIALGGSAYAATALPKGSVGAKQLRNGAVTPSKLSPQTKALFAAGSGARGGGATGATGPAGPPGASGVLEANVLRREFLSIPNCGRAVAFERHISLTAPARIFALAQGTYHKPGATPESASLQVLLLDEQDETVASSIRTLSGAKEIQTNANGDVFAGGLLMGPRDEDLQSEVVDSSPYVAAPGEYTLVLEAGSLGQCGPDNPYMWDVQMSYMLLAG